MAKIIKFTVGDEEHILDVGKWCFTKYYGQAMAKDDPLNGTSIAVDPEQQFRFTVALVFAGKKSYYKTIKKDVDFTMESIAEVLDLLEDDEIQSIIDRYVEFKKSKEPGELMAPTGQ